MQANNSLKKRDQGLPERVRESTNFSSGIDAIALQIKSRAEQLGQEEILLQDAEHELLDAKKREVEEDQRRRECRQKYLESSKQLSSHELRCIKVENDTMKQVNMNNKLRHQTNEIQERLNAEQQRWGLFERENTLDVLNISKNEHVSMLSKSRTDMILYEKLLSRAIQSVEERKLIREHKLKSSLFITKSYENKIKETRGKKKKIEEEIVQLQENEAEANRKVEFVADQVRLALTKRTSLRRDLREVEKFTI